MEERQQVTEALWWSLGAAPVFAAVTATRWARYGDRRRTGTAFLTAVVAATLIGGGFLGFSMAVYRWVIPLNGDVRWWGSCSAGPHWPPAAQRSAT